MTSDPSGAVEDTYRRCETTSDSLRCVRPAGHLGQHKTVRWFTTDTTEEVGR